MFPGQEDDSNLISEEGIDEFCDQLVGAWQEATQEVLTINLLRDAINQAKTDGSLNTFLRSMLE